MVRLCELMRDCCSGCHHGIEVGSGGGVITAVIVETPTRLDLKGSRVC